MKQFIEFVPLILFFVVYQMNGESIEIAGWSHTVDGIYSATKALMAATLITLPIIWLLAGELEKRLIWTSVAVFVFGGATLAFNNELFIQWKPTVFNWGMAVAFAASQFIGSKNLIERLIGSQLQLPTRVWRKLCWIWVAHFSMVGVLNLVVAYQFSEATWVAYKLWSAIAFTLFIMVITMLVMAPWLKSEKMAPDTGSEQDSH